MNAVIEGDVRRDIGGDQQRVGQIETDVGALTFKHVLLPIWVAAYRYRGKSFRFVVNGRTGAVQGERPWSPWKIGLAIAVAVCHRLPDRRPPDRRGLLMRRRRRLRVLVPRPPARHARRVPPSPSRRPR